MGLPVHTAIISKGTTALTNPFQFSRGVIAGFALGAAGGAGQSQAATVTGLDLPATYAVIAANADGQDGVINISSKSSSGFTVTRYPRLAANTLSAGSVDIFIIH